jgi:hypothetical protein
MVGMRMQGAQISSKNLITLGRNEKLRLGMRMIIFF